MIGLKKISFNNYLLLFVLTVAAALRFWKFPEMQFMHDELSAVIRSQANSFSELIYKTKTTDVHPVAVPVFIHYWTALFGTSGMAVKLPFILFGLLSVYYSYKIAEKWFNPTVAIITITFLATLQFPTMYGQLARPYATGMLFAALMCWCWTQFFFGEKDRQNKYAIGFVLFASLCTYNHYFSLLFAAIVGATGILFLNKENVKKYLLMCLGVMLLFVPHVSILFFHLSVGGEGEESWLGKPQPDWILTFINYLFHYSAIVYLLVAVLFLAGFYFRSREIKAQNKMRLLALIWALLVPGLAYFYSIYKTPVLQFSSFTFSLPFLLMLIFSFYGELKKPVKITLIVLIILINMFTLFANRKHYPLFYKHPYEQIAAMRNRAIESFGSDNVSVASAAMAGFVEHYFPKGRVLNYFRVDNPDTKTFLKYLENERTDYFVAGNLPLEYYQLIKERYPYVICKEEGFTYSVYCFAKNKPEREIKETIVFSENQNEHALSRYWDTIRISPENFDDPAYMKLDSGQEYSAGFSAKLCDIIKSKHTILNVSAEIGIENESSNPTLVVSIDDSGESLLWRGSEYQEYKTGERKWNLVCVSNLFSGTALANHPNATIKIYVWNRDKSNIRINNLKAEVIESNPEIYGLYEPME